MDNIFNTINWDRQYRMIQLEFADVKFYRVGTDLTYDEFKSTYET